MNRTNLITLLITGPVAVTVVLTAINLILRKLRSAGEEDLRMRPAYGIWFCGLLLSALLPQVQVILLLSEATDNILKMNFAAINLEVAKTAILFTGIGVLWFFLLSLVSRGFAVLLVGLRKEGEEMALGNTYYFLVRAVLLLGLTVMMMPALVLVLRGLMPSVSLPFVH